jgi:hypothetical protein
LPLATASETDILGLDFRIFGISLRGDRMVRAMVRRFAGALLAALLLAGMASPASAGERREFLIELDGTFAEFVMYCTLIDGDIRKTVRRREYLPESYRIEAEAVSCTVTMLDYRGRISGKLYADGRLIASAAQNAIRPIIKLRSDGPWGPARGARSSVPIRPTRPPAHPEKPPAPIRPEKPE